MYWTTRKLLKGKRRSQKRMLKEQKQTISADVKSKLKAKCKVPKTGNEPEMPKTKKPREPRMPKTQKSKSKQGKRRQDKSESSSSCDLSSSSFPGMAPSSSKSFFEDSAKYYSLNDADGIHASSADDSAQSVNSFFESIQSGKVQCMETFDVPVLPDIDLDLDNLLMNNVLLPEMKMTTSISSHVNEFYQESTSGFGLPQDSDLISGSGSFVTLNNAELFPASLSSSLHPDSKLFSVELEELLSITADNYFDCRDQYYKTVFLL